MICENCGKETSDNSKFCSCCGKPTNASSTLWFRRKKVWLITLFIIIIVISITFFLSNKSPVSESKAGMDLAKWAKGNDLISEPSAVQIDEIVCYQALNEDGSIKNTQYAVMYTREGTGSYTLIFVENDGIVNGLSYDNTIGLNAEYAQVYLQRYKQKEKGYFKLNFRKVQKSYDENI